MHAVYGFDKSQLSSELKRVFADRVRAGDRDSAIDSNEIPEVALVQSSGIQAAPDRFDLQSWAERFSKSKTSTQGNVKDDVPIEEEFDQFFSEVTCKTLSDSGCLSFWVEAHKMRRFPKLYSYKLSKLFSTIPASAIPQERHFSELKRRCAGLRASTQVDTLDRDGVVYAWLDEDRQ